PVQKPEPPNVAHGALEIYLPKRCLGRAKPKMPEKREPPRGLLDLVARYTEHREAYKADAYKEAELRKEFLDPLLELLGWDVANRQGYAEAYKEVIHEYAMSIGRTTKAPDY